MFKSYRGIYHESIVFFKRIMKSEQPNYLFSQSSVELSKLITEFSLNRKTLKKEQLDLENF